MSDPRGKEGGREGRKTRVGRRTNKRKDGRLSSSSYFGRVSLASLYICPFCSPFVFCFVSPLLVLGSFKTLQKWRAAGKSEERRCSCSSFKKKKVKLLPKGSVFVLSSVSFSLSLSLSFLPTVFGQRGVAAFCSKGQPCVGWREGRDGDSSEDRFRDHHVIRAREDSRSR